MRSRIAEETRRAQAAREAALTMDERLALLEQANELSLELCAGGRGISRAEALQLLARRNPND